MFMYCIIQIKVTYSTQSICKCTCLAMYIYGMDTYAHSMLIVHSYVVKSYFQCLNLCKTVLRVHPYFYRYNYSILRFLLCTEICTYYAISKLLRTCTLETIAQAQCCLYNHHFCYSCVHALGSLNKQLYHTYYSMVNVISFATQLRKQCVTMFTTILHMQTRCVSGSYTMYVRIRC